MEEKKMTKTVLKIDGMMCGMCESHVNDAIRNAFAVKKVSSSHAKGETEVISEEALDEAKLAEVIKNTGYTLNGISSEPYEKEGFFSFLKKIGSYLSMTTFIRNSSSVFENWAIPLYFSAIVAMEDRPMPEPFL